MSEPSLPTPSSDEVLDEFLARYTGNTLQSYQSDLFCFYRWCEAQEIDPLSIRRPQIDVYKKFLSEEKRYADSTVYRRITCLRQFFEFAVEEDYIAKSPAKAVKARRPDWSQMPPIALSRDEFQKLVVAASPDAGDWAAICILGYLGLRVFELCSLNVEDCQQTQDGVRAVTFVGKGGVPATMPLTGELLAAVDAAIGGRTTGPLVVREDGTRHTRRSMQRVVARLGKAAGIDKPITPHTLRHTFVVMAIDAGVHPRAVQIAARHRDIATTMLYDRQRTYSMTNHPANTVQAFMRASA